MRRRVGLWDAHTAARSARTAAMTPEQKALEKAKQQAQLLLPVQCAPVKGDPHVIDWDTCDCGYVPLTKPDGKPLPKTGPNAEPAWRWTEDDVKNGKAAMAPYVKGMAKVYGLGYRHNPIELHTEGGHPDWQFTGRGRPGVTLYRELKKMDHHWRRGQKQHLLHLQETGHDADVWYPCCILSGRVDEEMAALGGVEPRGPHARRQPGQPNQPLTWKEIADGALSR